MMLPKILFVVMWLGGQAVGTIVKNSLTGDILSSYLLPNLDTNSLMDMLSVNRKWSVSAVRVLSSRTRFLSTSQMKLILHRFNTSHFNELSTEISRIKYNLEMRNVALSLYNKGPGDSPLSPLQLTSRPGFYLFRIGREIKQSQYCTVSIEALIRQQNVDNFHEVTSPQTTKLAIKKDPIIQVNGDKIILFASMNGIDYIKCVALEFDTTGNQEILGYNVRIHLSMVEIFSVASHCVFHMDRYDFPAPIQDVYAVGELWTDKRIDEEDDLHFEMRRPMSQQPEHLCRFCIAQ